MEARTVFACLAFISSFFAAAALFTWAFSGVRQRVIAGRAHAGTMPHQGLVASALRNGIPQIMPVAHMLLANKKVEHFFTCAQQVAAIRSYMTTPQALCSLCCAGVLFVAAAAAALTASVVLGLLVAFGLVLALGFMVAQVLEKRREALREAIPDALRSMSVCSHAGFSLLQTFQQVAKEADEPLRSLFLTAVHDLETGRTVSEALEAFRKNADVSELAFVAVALDIQHRAGGSLKQVLEAARDAVESELNLKRSLRVQTAQAKLSARIVSVMPFVLITIFSLLSPGFLTPFFGSLLGIVLLGLAASMQLAGIYLVRRLLDVKVD